MVQVHRPGGQGRAALSQLEGYLKRGREPEPKRRKVRLPRASDYILTPAELRELVSEYPDRSLALGFALAAVVLLASRGGTFVQGLLGSGSVLAGLLVVSSQTATLSAMAVLGVFLLSSTLFAPLVIVLQLATHAALTAYAPLPYGAWASALLTPAAEVLGLVLALRLAVGRRLGGTLGWRSSATDLTLLGAAMGAGLDLAEWLLGPTHPGWWAGLTQLGLLGGAQHTIFGALVGLTIGRARLRSWGQVTLSEWLWVLALWGWLERVFLVGVLRSRPLDLPPVIWELLPLARLHGLLGLLLLILLLLPTLFAELRVLGRHRAVDPELAAGPGWRGLRPPSGVDNATWLGRWMARRMSLGRIQRAIAYGFHYAAFRGGGETQEGEDSPDQVLSALRLHGLALQSELKGPGRPAAEEESAVP